ncbi:hypothetical protein PybrP1_000607 [[Pythium] brassicae (nom. inval.)]|nr:hypothetical protein PybrP1_000607 [[Pythium] brassicae (nom. inval.)]
MAYLVSINSSHIVNNGLNNQFTYRLPSVATNLTNSEIAVSSIQINVTPETNPVSSYQVHCGLIDNKFSMPPDILTTFNSAGTSIGKMINFRPNEHVWQTCASGSFSSITLYIADQSGQSVKFNDKNTIIELIFRSKKDM